MKMLVLQFIILSRDDMEIKDYTITGMTLALAISLGFNLIPDPNYYCKSRELKAYCFDLSETMKTCYTLPNKKGGKRCTDSWKEITVQEVAINYVGDFTLDQDGIHCYQKGNLLKVGVVKDGNCIR